MPALEPPRGVRLLSPAAGAAPAPLGIPPAVMLALDQVVAAPLTDGERVAIAAGRLLRQAALRRVGEPILPRAAGIFPGQVDLWFSLSLDGLTIGELGALRAYIVACRRWERALAACLYSTLAQADLWAPSGGIPEHGREALLLTIARQAGLPADSQVCVAKAGDQSSTGDRYCSYWLDVACRDPAWQLRLDLEVDGAEHGTLYRWHRDNKRDSLLQARG